MQLVFDTPAAKVVTNNGTCDFYAAGEIDFEQVARHLALLLETYFTASFDRTHDELQHALLTVQQEMVEACDFDKAAACRDARRVIINLVASNENLREVVRQLRSNHQSS